MTIQDQDSLTGDFTLKGLQISSTVKISTTVQVSINMPSYTEDFQFTVTQPTIPKIGEFTVTVIPPKNADSSDDVSLGTGIRKLVVYNNDLYVFQNSKYFVSSNGINWTEKTNPPSKKYTGSDGIEYNASMQINQSYVVKDNKLWALGTLLFIWSFDGSAWKNYNASNNLVATHNVGASSIWDNKIWLFGSDIANKIQSSPNGLDWTESSIALPKKTLFFSAVQHQDEILLMGGSDVPNKVSYDQVYSFDDKQLQQEGTLPKSNFAYGLGAFAGGLVVVGGDYYDSKTLKSLNSLWYSPYGSYWTELTADWTQGGNDAPTGRVYSMVKWQPKTGSHSNKEALWISDNNKIYKITYTKK